MSTVTRWGLILSGVVLCGVVYNAATTLIPEPNGWVGIPDGDGGSEGQISGWGCEDVAFLRQRYERDVARREAAEHPSDQLHWHEMSVDAYESIQQARTDCEEER